MEEGRGTFCVGESMMAEKVQCETLNQQATWAESKAAENDDSVRGSYLPLCCAETSSPANLESVSMARDH